MLKKDIMLVYQLPKSTGYAGHLLRRPRRVSLLWRYSSASKHASIRVFNSSSELHRDQPPQQSAQQRLPPKVDLAESIKPESVQKPTAAASKGIPRTDILLTEQTVSNKEQRKADWAIMKEMARYLWPKVLLPRTVQLV